MERTAITRTAIARNSVNGDAFQLEDPSTFSTFLYQLRLPGLSRELRCLHAQNGGTSNGLGSCPTANGATGMRIGERA